MLLRTGGVRKSSRATILEETLFLLAIIYCGYPLNTSAFLCILIFTSNQENLVFCPSEQFGRMYIGEGDPSNEPQATSSLSVLAFEKGEFDSSYLIIWWGITVPAHLLNEGTLGCLYQTALSLESLCSFKTSALIYLLYPGGHFQKIILFSHLVSGKKNSTTVLTWI